MMHQWSQQVLYSLLWLPLVVGGAGPSLSISATPPLRSHPVGGQVTLLCSVAWAEVSEGDALGWVLPDPSHGALLTSAGGVGNLTLTSTLNLTLTSTLNLTNLVLDHTGRYTCVYLSYSSSSSSSYNTSLTLVVRGVPSYLDILVILTCTLAALLILWLVLWIHCVYVRTDEEEGGDVKDATKKTKTSRVLLMS